MNEQDILEVRFSNHYETKKAALEKSNNRTQYLYQVVLKTPSTKMGKDSISNTTSIANLKILTNGVINRNTSEDEIKVMLMNIHDFLISPSKSFEDATTTNESKTYRNMKNRIKLNESTLKQIIAESVSRVLSESQVYTREDWRKDGDINPRPGQIVADDVIEGLASNVPPKTWKHSIFQFGERRNSDGYMTFGHTKDGWAYIGICEELI